MFDIYELLPGFVFATIAIFVVSKLTGGAQQEIKDEFAKVQSMLTKGLASRTKSALYISKCKLMSSKGILMDPFFIPFHTNIPGLPTE